MTYKEIDFFKRTIGVLNSINSDLNSFEMNFNDFEITKRRIKPILNKESYFVFLNIYSHEYNLYTHYLEQNICKDKLLNERINKINRVNQIGHKGNYAFLNEVYSINKINVIRKLRLDVRSISTINKSSINNNESYTFFIKPSLRNDILYDEILLKPNKFDYILTDLWEHNEPFSGSDIMEALGDSKESNLEDVVCDKLIQYLTMFDALKIEMS